MGAAKSEICRSCWRPTEKLTLQSGGRTASSLGDINLYLKTFKLIGWQLPNTLCREINCTQSLLISMFITSKKYPNTWTCVWSNIWAPEPSQVDTENEPSQMPSQKSGIRGTDTTKLAVLWPFTLILSTFSSSLCSHLNSEFISQSLCLLPWLWEEEWPETQGFCTTPWLRVTELSNGAEFK